MRIWTRKTAPAHIQKRVAQLMKEASPAFLIPFELVTIDTTTSKTKAAPGKESQVANDPNGRMVIQGMANVAEQDRWDDIILGSAWDLKNWKKNPIILFNHYYNQVVGIGIGSKLTDKGLEITAELGRPEAGHELTQCQKDVRSLVAQGILCAFSVGFLVTEWSYNEDTEILTYTSVELLEVSIVSVPCQQDSLFESVKGAKRMETEPTKEQKDADPTPATEPTPAQTKASEEASALIADVTHIKGLCQTMHDKIVGAADTTATDDTAKAVEEAKALAAEVTALKAENAKLSADLTNVRKLLQTMTDLLNAKHG